MALSSYAYFKDDGGNDIKGSVTQAGREESCEIIGWSHEVIRPTDPMSGEPTGDPLHGLFMITQAYDVASPILQQAAFNGTQLERLELHCFRPSPAGTEEHYITIILEWLRVQHMRPEQLNNKYPENMKHAIRIHLGFSYQQIEYQWIDGGITARGSWTGARRG